MGCACHSGTSSIGFRHVEGASAEQLQVPHARNRSTRTLFAGAVSNGRLGRGGRFMYADVTSPQVFPERPVIRNAIASTTVGSDTAAPHLPGRPPPGAWDGEPGYAAPRIV